ncbi:hypothetical protein Leryth_016041 [Lithospermum erythrorhizon]|uniref:Inhibitor I9 domain-containing protein n=1 Tax=Lithospermum erythrorhizon TaxID=34254 RepID=A0AAV3Q904_LITER|nr:hypothetical protein Leryth_016041 [Lithospermum erythrorhizon]
MHNNSVVVLILLFFSSSVWICIAKMGEAKVYIVYTERPEEGVDQESFHVNTLASVYGSEEAAKGALIHSYKHAACGFSAKLTPQQVDQLSKQPGVLQVVPSRTLQLHSGPANFNV